MRLLVFVTYLASWSVFAVAALWSTVRKFREPACPVNLHAPLVIGTLLQFAGALAVTLAITPGQLSPNLASLIAVLLLAPGAAILFLWTLRSQGSGLVTTGAYSLVRHPLYLSFLLMLVATGLLVAVWPKLLAAVALYVAGSEIRIATEERELAGYEAYKQQVRWRYLPGIR